MSKIFWRFHHKYIELEERLKSIKSNWLKSINKGSDSKATLPEEFYLHIEIDRALEELYRRFFKEGV